MKIPHPLLFPSLILIFFMVSSAAIHAQPRVSFDWFEYQGKDEIFDTALQDNHFRNPIIAGFHPDPSIVRVEDDYYLVNSSFAWFPGLPIFHSKDLVNWKQIGHALSRRSQLKFENGQGISRGIFAPTIRYHDGLFYIITTDVDGIGNFYITAKDPAGPWSDPVTLAFDGIDPDLFFDDDGRIYIAHNGAPQGEALYDGHRAVWVWEFDPEADQVKADSGRVIVNGGVDLSTKPIWIEGPHIYKVNGWYYLVCAEGGTSDEHSQVVFRTRNLDEPLVPYEHNPILTQRDLDPDRQNPVTSVGHADLVQTPEGDWWSVFLGVRPYVPGYYNTGRETFLLPVSWENEWPHILAPQEPVPWQVPLPQTGLNSGDAQEKGEIAPQTGNFVWRDDFDAASLSFEWLRPRTSATDFVQLKPGDGSLELTARPVGLEEKTQPALLARAQQHVDFSASTGFELPAEESVSAGLVLFQNSDFNYFFGVTRSGQQYKVFLEQIRDGVRSVIQQKIAENPAVLEVEQHGENLSFHYSTIAGDKIELASGVDARLLSTKEAGGFVGAMIGLYARLDKP